MLNQLIQRLAFAQLHTQGCAGGIGKSHLDRRQPPSLINLWRHRRGKVWRICCHMTGATGDAFGPDPAVACLNGHAMFGTLFVSQSRPTRSATFAYMAVTASRVG